MATWPTWQYRTVKKATKSLLTYSIYLNIRLEFFPNSSYENFEVAL